MMVESTQQLEELLADPGYARTIALLTKEVMSTWNLSYTDARGLVLSAIGEPTALACIYRAWVIAKTGVKTKFPAVISRRRVLDLLRKDARRANHTSIPIVTDELERDSALGALHTGTDRSPEAQLECQQFVAMIRAALACFAATGVVHSRQAHLLRRRVFEEVPYPRLAEELSCSENALRVRVHAALKALHRHILLCHPELTSMRAPLAHARNV